MSRVGRKRKPVEIKKIQGTFRKDRDGNTPDLSKKLVSLPNPPKDLRGDGLLYYKNQGPKLLAIGLLTEFSITAFLSMCYILTRLSEITNRLSHVHSVSEEVTLSNLYLNYQRNLRLTLAEFGLTPASAGKVRLFEEKKDELDDFIKSKNG